MGWSRARDAAKAAILVFFVGWAIWFVIAHWSQIAAALSVRSVPDLGIVFAAHIGFLWVNAAVLRAVLKKFGIPLGRAEALHLSIVTSAGNSLFPMTPGLVLRGYYLRTRRGFSVPHFVGSLAGTYLLAYNVAFGVAILCGLILYFRHGMTHAAVNVILAVGFVITSSLVFSGGRMSLTTNRRKRWLGGVLEAVEGWRRIAADLSLVGRLACLSVGSMLVATATLYFSFAALSLSPMLWGMLYLTALNCLSAVFNLTPGNVGVTEGIFVFGGTVIGLPAAQVLMAALVLRVSFVLLLLVLFPFSLHALFRSDWKRALREAQEGPRSQPGQ